MDHPGWDPYPFGWLINNATGGQGFQALPPNLIPCLFVNTLNAFIIFFAGFITAFIGSLILQVTTKVLESRDRVVARIKIDKAEDAPQLYAYLKAKMKEEQQEVEIQLNMLKKNQ